MEGKHKLMLISTGLSKDLYNKRDFKKQTEAFSHADTFVQKRNSLSSMEECQNYFVYSKYERENKKNT